MIWLVGYKGMLGSEVRAQLDRRGLSHVDTDMDVDIAEPGAVRKFLDGQPTKPASIVNCAAYTAVDKAEDDSANAYRVNATGVGVLAAAAERTGASLVHISTDYVFDGKQDRAYAEDDPPGPLGVYGASKLTGEEMARARCRNHYIVRSSWLFGKGGPNFVATMLRLFGERDEVRVVADQWGRPTCATDLAGAIAEIVASTGAPWGTYHYCNHGRTSWHGFAQAILEGARARGLLNRDVRVTPISTSEYPTRARRPASSELSTAKIESALSLRIPGWADALARYLDHIEQGAKR